ncbi:MAG: hypothetical protein WAJ85_00640 [Candidatus Baltobacteraceae bacterium]|jgi:hypothetical protein
MSTLSERTRVEVPAAQSQARLAEYFHTLAGRRNGTVRLSLSLPVTFPGLVIPLSLQRTVVATLTPFRLPGDVAPRREVHWAPLRPGPFPSFRGELTVEAAEDGRAFWLELEGTYEPPIGLIGEAFDAVVGHNIARVTALNLLGRIKASLEDAARADEAGAEVAGC